MYSDEDTNSSDDDHEERLRRREEEQEQARIRQIRTVAKALLNTVSREFADWKREYILKPAQELLRATYPSSGSTQAFEPVTVSGPLLAAFEPTETDPDDVLVYCEYDENGKPLGPPQAVHVDVIDAPKLDEGQSYDPGPRYQYCAPTSSNYNARLHDHAQAQFMPFPDRDDFPRTRYMAAFNSKSAWTEMGRHGRIVLVENDPDRELVIYETIRRLHLDQGFDVDDLDDVLQNVEGMRGLPLRDADDRGFLWEYEKRDIPNIIWADGHTTATAPTLPVELVLPPSDPTNIIERLNRVGKRFCANLNCITNSCGVHISNDWEVMAAPVLKKIATRTSHEIVQMKQEEDDPEPCERHCFILNQFDDDDDMDGHLDATKRALAFGLLDLEPDFLPCDLAVIADLDCITCFKLRREYIDDKKVKAIPSESGSEEDWENWSEYGGRRSKLPPMVQAEKWKTSHTRPCNHDGPCDDACECVQEYARCERTCQCAPNCRNRWKGCNLSCAKRGNCGRFVAEPENTKNPKAICLCRRAGRECDPELCTGCNARQDPERVGGRRKGRRFIRKCDNMPVQRGECKAIDVKQSAYGFGAFAGEDIKTNDMVGDYTGEILFVEAAATDAMPVDHRAVLHDYIDTNYFFGLGRATIDARLLGNPTRFLNDAKPRKPNCRAENVLVNGQRRIWLRAMRPIEKGVELTLSYGDEYWKQKETKTGEQKQESRSGSEEV
uniref:SET-domain-containing protein n=1 Tax=Mycena chlorophos TaxID=658473 RepID=A0ABQ0M8Q3_MYCCL|nr:SET-domain-containing protein [Mycena chlorophos]